MAAAAEATIAAGDYVFPSHEFCVALDALRDKLRMFDYIGRMRHYSGNKNSSIRQFNVLPHGPFVLMTGIRAFDRICPGVYAEQDADEVFQF